MPRLPREFRRSVEALREVLDAVEIVERFEGPGFGVEERGGDEHGAAEQLLFVEDRVGVFPVRELHVARRCNHAVVVERTLERGDVDGGWEVVGAHVLRELPHLFGSAGGDDRLDREVPERGEPADHTGEVVARCVTE